MRLRGFLIAGVLVVATVIAVGVALSGGDGGDGSESPGGGHVHGLGVNRAD